MTAFKLSAMISVYKVKIASKHRIGQLKAGLVDGNSSAHGYEVKKAQLLGVLTNIPVTLIANCFIALSAALLIYYERGDYLVFGWLAGIVGLNLLRFVYGLRVLRAIPSNSHPGTALRNLTILAFVAGVSWIPLPIYFLNLIESRTSAYIVFIMAGITTGAIIQSLAYWRISVAFGSPILLATLAKLLLQGNVVDLVVAANLFLLMAMLMRSAIISEANFCRNHSTTLQATELAHSLQLAHNDVQTANETLKRLATTDPLTGLPNRSVFNQTLAHLIHDREAVSLALVDIDKFKLANDTLGHAAGDQILCTLALLMLDRANGDMIPIRLGGDEFAVIASGPDCTARLMDYVATLREDLKMQPGDVGNVTLSVGICADKGGQCSAADLFAAADRALYAAKAAGRDCVRSA